MNLTNILLNGVGVMVLGVWAYQMWINGGIGNYLSCPGCGKKYFRGMMARCPFCEAKNDYKP